MKTESLPVELNQANPQLALEKILTAEIEVAEQVSAARDKADKIIASAQSDLIKMKNQILADAREKRDKAFNEGVINARESAEKMIAAAQTESANTIINGRQYLDEAVESAIDFLIGQNRGNK